MINSVIKPGAARGVAAARRLISPLGPVGGVSLRNSLRPSVHAGSATARNAPDFSEPDFLFKLLFNTRGYALGSHRFFMDSAVALLPTPKGARYRYSRLAGVPVMWIGGYEKKGGPLLFYLHGGGYVMGSPRTHRSLSAYLCRASKAKGLVVDYRLAPEHPFPAALEDVLDVYRFLVKNGMDSKNILVAGDSAGGGLTAALLLAIARENLPMPCAAHLMSPWADLTASRRYYRFMRHRAKHVVDWGADAMAAMYVGESDPADPLISPVYGDFTGVCPMLITAGRSEPLRHDGRILAEHARSFGVDARFLPYDGPVHVFQALAPLVGSAEALIERAGAFFIEQLGQ
ncbi:MAG: alpha/beta hydrolase [Deltaproteobacteria bacterium]|nr:alpha/beta hydrolase [Deltaproteobacteria bacterium]